MKPKKLVFKKITLKQLSNVQAGGIGDVQTFQTGYADLDTHGDIPR